MKSWSIAAKVSIGAGLLYVFAVLAPFAVTEWWGMMWMYVAAPFSMIFEGTFGIGPNSILLILLATVLNGAVFGFILYSVIRCAIMEVVVA